MGTRSRIAIMKKDGSLRSIYCHWDGYLEHNGVILAMHYDTEDKVNALIDLGDLSSLERTLDATISYHKWRDEPLRIAEHKDLDDFFSYLKDGWEEYSYVFKDNKWYYFECGFGNKDNTTLILLKPELVERGMI